MFKSSVIIAAITTILMVGGNCYAQSCRYEKNVIDALTEVPVRVTQPVTIGKLNNNPLYFKAQSVGIRYRFLKMKYYRYEGFSINEQREIAFRLSTNEEIVIQPRINPADTVQGVGETISSLIVYPLTADQYEKLKRFPVTSFKYFGSDGAVEMPIKESRQSKIMEILNCID